MIDLEKFEKEDLPWIKSEYENKWWKSIPTRVGQQGILPLIKAFESAMAELRKMEQSKKYFHSLCGQYLRRAEAELKNNNNERERCAKIAEDCTRVKPFTRAHPQLVRGMYAACEEIAEEIRRGK